MRPIKSLTKRLHAESDLDIVCWIVHAGIDDRTVELSATVAADAMQCNDKAGMFLSRI